MSSPDADGAQDGKRRRVDLRLGFEGMTLSSSGRLVSPPLSAQKHESPPSDSPGIDVEEVSGWQPNAQQGKVEEPHEQPLDGVNVEELPEDEIYEIPRREHDLYDLEDEKWHYIDNDPDRECLLRYQLTTGIHISSLSDSSGSPPPSPHRGTTPQPGSLEQPGQNGFTISPSFLTHMLRANANAASSVPLAPYHWDPDREKKLGLVLYRQPQEAQSTQSFETGRFEALDDAMELDSPMDVDTGGDMDIE